MAKLLFQGHGSFRITSNKGTVIYVDPFAGEGYDQAADLILVTHQHGDHNQLGIVKKKSDVVIIQNNEALVNGKYQKFTVKDIEIQAVSAYNANHKREESVGYIITVDNVKVYAAGDTSTTEEMKEFAALNLDYALYPIDGIYNMGPEEATKAADTVAAKHSIPIHMKPLDLFDMAMAEKFKAKNRLIISAGEEIDL